MQLLAHKRNISLVGIAKRIRLMQLLAHKRNISLPGIAKRIRLMQLLAHKRNTRVLTRKFVILCTGA
jgi:hypothetical protein